MSHRSCRLMAPHLVAIALTALATTVSFGDPCVLPDNGTGTVTLPDPACPYLSPDEFHMVVDGLPPGTEIIVTGIHKDFLCRQGVPPDSCFQPGGPLGGELEQFDSVIGMEMFGTGDLTGFQRAIEVPIFCVAATGPRVPGDPVQDFQNEMVALQGGIFGDPDFDLLQVRAGGSFGLPSPGHTTLTRLGPPGSDFTVDSFFDITYQIEFQGAPGGALGGLAGTTTGTLRMQSGDSAATPAPEVESDTWGRVKTRYRD